MNGAAMLDWETGRFTGRIPSRPTVMLCSGNGRVATALADELAAHDFTVRISDGAIDLDLIRAVGPDLVLIERLTVPARVPQQFTLATRCPAPWIVIGANHGNDAVEALDAGAAAYISSPQRAREVASRLRAVLRRTHPSSRGPQAVQAVGDLKIDRAGGTVTLRDTVIDLSDRDLAILSLLAARVGRVVTHDHIAGEVWPGVPCTSRNVSEQIRRIRGRIEDDPRRPRRILTVRGLGYRMVAP